MRMPKAYRAASTMRVPLFDMVMCLSSALDLVSPALGGHHKRVACIASRIAEEMGLSRQKQALLIMAGALHDTGAMTLRERLGIRRFEVDSPFRHTVPGYLLFREFAPFSGIAPLVLHHHTAWGNGRGAAWQGTPVPIESHILHLADRVDICLDRRKEVLGQAGAVNRKIARHCGSKFAPEVVAAFARLARNEYFWLDILSPTITRFLVQRMDGMAVDLDVEGLMSLGRMFARVIDFRSRFTATHSSGVAAVAADLASALGFPSTECQWMKVAGYLHDLGKLAVPPEILDKTGRLTRNDYNVIRSHSFHTYRILENIGGLETINAWASFHHERLDGKGYPFHHKAEALSLGSRIMTVADHFTGLTEDRPYRRGMTTDEALEILRELVRDNAMDGSVVSVLARRRDDLNVVRLAAQDVARREYESFDRQRKCAA